VTTSSRHSRRSFVGGLAAGAVILGFSSTDRLWVTDIHATGGLDVDAIPPLDGQLAVDDPSRDAAAIDFGRLGQERPAAVLKPGSARDLARILRFARRHDLRVAVRGRGHSIQGETLVEGGIVVDMSTLRQVHQVTDDTVIADAGCSWGDVLDATLPVALTPPVLPDYPGLSVGGTLSIGGIGPATFRYGAQVDHVLSLLVVTGEGDILWCSRTRKRDLFEAALAGQGQCAIIARAEIRLVPAPASVRVFSLAYPDVATAMGDAARLTDDGRFDGVLTFVGPTAGPPAVILVATAYFTGPAEPENAALLAGLRHRPGAVQVADMTYRQYCDRVAGPFPPLPHPALSLIVPSSSAVAFVEQALARLTPGDLGAYGVIELFDWQRAAFTRPLFRVPDEPRCVGVAVLRNAGTPALQAQMLAGNEVLHGEALRLGGTAYPFSAVVRSADDWRRHYGPQWRALLRAKRRYDRDDRLASGPDVLGGATR
jgi:FAD/FMN-containing dehydrogenase